MSPLLKSLHRFYFAFFFLLGVWSLVLPAHGAVTVTGEIVDSSTENPIPARIYIQNDAGKWFFPVSAAKEGSAIRYERQNGSGVEKHTTLSAHPFTVTLETGRYTFTVERGKEYLPLIQTVEVGAEPLRVRLALHRWVNMASLGWFSGDTHNHRAPAELPNVMQAEDVNVALPMVYWTTTDAVPPSKSPQNIKGDFPAELIRVDETHVIWPRNTEYEIFNTAKKPHTLGALLAVNHRSVFNLPALPVTKVAELAHSEGALLDLEKHNWPWSLALVPLVKPDLFELANNHHWRTEFSVKNWAEPAPAWMGLGTGSGNERQWTLYGFQTYYTLLDAGFHLSPAAGTANGVHPVPLGFGRVYVHLGKKFDYDDWMKGLKAGHSFVTTGPMLRATVNGELSGNHIPANPGKPASVGKPLKLNIKGTVMSEQAVPEIELIVNGEVAKTLSLRPTQTRSGAWEADFATDWTCDATSWVALRCFEPREGKRFRFAHTAPWWVDVADKPLRPKKQEIEWLIQSVRKELERSTPLLPPEAIREYESAISAYEQIARDAQ